MLAGVTVGERISITGLDHSPFLNGTLQPDDTAMIRQSPFMTEHGLQYDPGTT